MTLDELNKLVRDVINDFSLPIEVIEYHPNAPRIELPFATVYCAEGTKIGQRDVEYSSNAEDLDEKIIHQYEQRVSINFYRENANQYAEIISSSLGSNRTLELLNAASVGVSRISPIRDLTETFNASHEERAQVDWFLTFELTPVPIPVTGIDSAKIVGKVDNTFEIVDEIELPETIEPRAIFGTIEN